MKVDIEHLNAVAGTLESLAGEAGGLATEGTLVPGNMSSAGEAWSINREVVNEALVPAVKERLSETAETMHASVKMYQNREDANSQMIAKVLSSATGRWSAE